MQGGGGMPGRTSGRLAWILSLSEVKSHESCQTYEPICVAGALAPTDGFGDAGLPPHVPGGTKLEVEVELLAFKRVENVTEDGGVVRKVLEEAKASGKSPNEGAQVGREYNIL